MWSVGGKLAAPMLPAFVGMELGYFTWPGMPKGEGGWGDRGRRLEQLSFKSLVPEQSIDLVSELFSK